jgi:zinc protease
MESLPLSPSSRGVTALTELQTEPADPTREIPAVPHGTRLVTLENGLVIIVREDHSAPVVSAQAWCKSGSIDEGQWLGAGLSHLLEHMLFKGTTTRGAGRIDQEIQDAGGYLNAFTSFDRTVFWINVPNTGARVALDVLCDIVQHATLPAEELAKEMDVIRREMDMNQDDPHRRSSRRLFEVAYTRSPYRYTVIGYPQVFNQLTREDILAYYHAKYVPNNCFFVVVGDVNAGAVIGQVREAFAEARLRPLPPVALPVEPPQTAPREVIEEADVELGHSHVAWHIPELRHPDVPLLDVLGTLLGGGRSSRLYQQVREKLGLVNSVDAWTYNPGNPGLFGVSVLVSADKFDAAREAVLAEIERVKRDSVTAEELTKAVKQFTAGALATRKTMQGQAHELGGSWLAANDLNFTERYLAAVRRATAADIQRVARQYLTPENRTLYALLPSGTAPQPAQAAARTAEHAIRRFELPNGLRLLVKPDHRLPFVEFRAVFKGGVLAETPESSGLTQLSTRLLLKGTATRTAEQIATEIESVGGSLDTYAGNNSFGVSAEVLSGDFGTALDLLADVLLHPAFPADALERERQVQLDAIRAQKDHLLQHGFRVMRHGLFGDGGYGLDALGTEESVQALDVHDVRSFHQKLVVPNNCVLAVFGDVEPAAACAAVESALASWGAGEPFAPAHTGHTSQRVRRLIEARGKQQAVLVIGFPGTSLHDADRYPLELLQEACSDLGSRLYLRIRENLGLAYAVGAQNFVGLAPGYFAFYVCTAPEKVERVEKELLEEALLLRAEGLTEEELKRSKAKVIGQKKIARQDLGHLAMNSALDELYGLGYAHSDHEDALYEAVTLDQIHAAAKKYFRPEAPVIAVVSPERG